MPQQKKISEGIPKFVDGSKEGDYDLGGHRLFAVFVENLNLGVSWSDLIGDVALPPSRCLAQILVVPNTLQLVRTLPDHLMFGAARPLSA